MERICGEIRLADFDTLELTNLNRIRTGLFNLGIPKVYAVAREIAEIDPYIKVICFEEGITETNMDRFFTEGGNLDLMIEESDGFDIKILSRIKARELKIPVLMEASDRCMLDVERFDLEPNRSILHGLVDHLDITTLKNLKTNEDKIPYMLDILGLETASLRIRASMLEIDQTINTWPQLASAVTMGGGITADIARRIFLKQYSGSGRYHIDIEELIGDNSIPYQIEKKSKPIEHTMVETDYLQLAKDINLESEMNQMSLSEEEIQSIVSAACLATSGGNSQPWRWVYKNKALLLFNAFDGEGAFLGYNNIASMIGFGAALENINLSAKQLNLKATFELFPDNSIKEWVASIRFFPNLNNEILTDDLANGIYTRLTNRNLGERKPIENEIIDKVRKATEQIEGAKLTVFSSNEDLSEIGELLGELEKIRLLEKMGHRDFVNEIRWNKEEAEEKKDGVDIRTIDLSNSEIVGLKVAKNENVMELINQWNGGGAFKKLTKKSIDAAGAVGIITMPGQTLTDYINGGRALQRAWIAANLNGIAFQPVSASVFVYTRVIQGKGIGISEKGNTKLLSLRPQFEKIFKINNENHDVFIFRLSKTSEPEIKSLRKPIEDVFINLEK